MKFLIKLREDINLAFENYNKENENAETRFEEIKKLFEPIMWEKNKNKKEKQ